VDWGRSSEVECSLSMYKAAGSSVARQKNKKSVSPEVPCSGQPVSKPISTASVSQYFQIATPGARWRRDMLPGAHPAGPQTRQIKQPVVLTGNADRKQ
jgi:hypothetical protein